MHHHPTLSPSPSLSYVCGVLKGDGWLSHDKDSGQYTIGLNTVDLKFSQNFQKALERIGLPARISKTKPEWKRKSFSRGRTAQWLTVGHSVIFYNWFASLQSAELEQIVDKYPI